MRDPLRPSLNHPITQTDGWEIIEGARLVTRTEFVDALPIGMMVTNVLARLLMLAADKTGRIASYEPDQIFGKHIMTALDAEPGSLAAPIHYDAFTAMVMAESVLFLVSAGYLAHRGGGDHAAYHLARPVTAARPTGGATRTSARSPLSSAGSRRSRQRKPWS